MTQPRQPSQAPINFPRYPPQADTPAHRLLPTRVSIACDRCRRNKSRVSDFASQGPQYTQPAESLTSATRTDHARSACAHMLSVPSTPVAKIPLDIIRREDASSRQHEQYRRRPLRHSTMRNRWAPHSQARLVVMKVDSLVLRRVRPTRPWELRRESTSSATNLR